MQMNDEILPITSILSMEKNFKKNNKWYDMWYWYVV